MTFPSRLHLRIPAAWPATRQQQPECRSCIPSPRQTPSTNGKMGRQKKLEQNCATASHCCKIVRTKQRIKPHFQNKHRAIPGTFHFWLYFNPKRDVRLKWLVRQTGAPSSPRESGPTHRCNPRNVARLHAARQYPPKLCAAAPRHNDSTVPSTEGERKHPQW